MAEEIKTISLSHRKEFSIDGDGNRILALDTSDMNVIVRLEEVYPAIQELAVEAQNRIANVKDSEDGSEMSPLNDISEILKDIDRKMREKVDYIFDADVSAKCAPKGNMFDPVNGEFRFEHIIDVLTTLYTENLSVEFKKMQDRVKKHTAKYTNNRTTVAPTKTGRKKH